MPMKKGHSRAGGATHARCSLRKLIRRKLLADWMVVKPPCDVYAAPPPPSPRKSWRNVIQRNIILTASYTAPARGGVHRAVKRFPGLRSASWIKANGRLCYAIG